MRSLGYTNISKGNNFKNKYSSRTYNFRRNRAGAVGAFLLCIFFTSWISTKNNFNESKNNNEELKTSEIMQSEISFDQFHHEELSKDSFSVPFCDSDGTCHETPDEPSPKTIYSSVFSKENYDKWWAFNYVLNERAREYIEKRKRLQIQENDRANKHHTRSLVFLGDSISESWLGSSFGTKSKRTKGIPQVFDKYFNQLSNPLFDPIVLALSGDQTQQLLYRMINGQLPSTTEDDAFYIVMIGTNNIGYGELPGPSARGVLKVADYVLSNTKGTLFLFHVLPRGDGFRKLSTLCPPRCTSNGEPFESFMPAVEKLNNAIIEGVYDDKDGLKQKHGNDRIVMMDCGTEFLSKNKGEKKQRYEVDETIMPDLLHPNAAGHEILAKCILSYINKD